MEEHICDLSAELRARGWDVVLAVCPRFGVESGARERLVRSGVRCYDLGDRETGAWRARVLSIFKLSALLMAERFDSIICHGVGMSHLTVVLGRRGARTIWHDHLCGAVVVGDERHFKPSVATRYPVGFRYFLKCVDGVITGSQQGVEHLKRLQSVRCPVVALAPLFKIPERIPRQRMGSSRIRCATFGSLGTQKGTERILRLWLRPELSEMKLFLFGEDPGGKYASLARSLNLTNVECRGAYKRNEFPRCAAEVELGIIGSLVEGYPLVALEMLGCGIPFVATKVGACPELRSLVGECGVVLAEEDEESLIAGILEIVERIKGSRVNAGAISRRARQVYDRPNVVERYVEFILPRQRAVGSRRGVG